MSEKVGRNDPCPCGSGKKYKQCCMKKEQENRSGAKYTASGKRKIRATAVSSSAEATSSLFGRVTPVQAEGVVSETLERMKYRTTNRDFRVDQEKEVSEAAPSEPIEAPETQKPEIVKEDETFEPTGEDFQVEEE